MARNRNGSFPPSVEPGIPSLGPLPKGWFVRQLGRCIVEVRRPIELIDNHVYSLITVKRNRGGAIKRTELRGKEIKVKAQNRVKAGDFLISKRQIVHGACAIVPKELNDSIVSNEYAIINCLKDLEIRYLRYLSETKYFQQTCFHSSIGVHVEKMVFKLEKWFKWPFNIPPLAEQRKIVRILSIWDAAIDCAKKLLENSLRQKKVLMQQLLKGVRRLPNYTNRWRRVSLGSIASCFSGGTPSSNIKEYYNGDIPWIVSGDLNKKYIYSVGQYISQHGIDNSSAKMIEQNTLLLALYGATAGVVAISKIQAAINQAIIAIVPHNDDSLFLFFLLESMKEKLLATYLQGGQPNLSGDIIKSIDLYLPSLEEQAAVANVLASCDFIINKYEELVGNYQCQKNTIMQQLLTGERRVKPDPEDYETE